MSQDSYNCFGVELNFKLYSFQFSNTVLILWNYFNTCFFGLKEITSLEIDREIVETVRLYFLGSKITADGDCSREIKRHLLLGRKVMTNLDSIFKSRDITLSTQVLLVKAMVFPVVMYGCESWTVKTAERQELMLLNCGVGEDS